MSLAALSIGTMLFSLIYLRFSLIVQIISIVIIIIYCAIKKINFLFPLLFIILFLTWNIRLERQEMIKNERYKVKVIKIGNRGKIIKIESKLSLKSAYINLNNLDIQDGLYNFDITIENIDKYKNILYYNVKVINFTNHWSNKYRNYIRNKIENISKNIEIEAFLKSVILAENSDLSEDLTAKFNYLGISHIIVISGLHIGIVLFGILAIYRMLGLAYHIKYLLTLFFLTVYSMMLGFSPSVQRAYIMATIFIISKIMFEKKDVQKSFNIALLSSLMFNPKLISDIGFQMSYVAVFAIIFVYKLLEDRIKSNLLKYFTLSLIIQLFLLPIFLYYFKTLYLCSFIANLIAIPISSLLIGFSFTGVLISVLNIDIINEFTSEVLVVLYRSLNGFVELLGAIPLMQIKLDNSISKFIFVWIYFGLAIFYMNLRKNSAKQASLKN